MSNKDTYEIMMDSLPPYYQDSYLVTHLIFAQSEELYRITDAAVDVTNEMFPMTSSLTLMKWEELFGIKTDTSKTLLERKQMIISKMRGFGTVTIPMLKEAITPFVKGDIFVEEYPSEYKIKVTFIGEKGVPAQFDTIQKVIRDIIPAHLLDEYVFNYLIFADIENNGLTWYGLEMDGTANRTWKEVSELMI